jgi:hypothetical protein
MRQLVFAVIALFGAGSVLAQDTSDQVFDEMIAAFEASAEGVNDYVVVTEAFTSYHRRMDTSEGTRFQVATKSTVGALGIGNMTTRFATDNPYALREMYGDAASLAAPALFDGEECMVVNIDTAALPASESDLNSMVLYVHPATWTLRGIRMAVSGDQTEAARELEVHFEDYRDDEGLLYPYRTRIVIPNPNAQLDDSQVERAREALEQIDARLADMPTEQREAMQKMMAGQIEKMEAMLAGGALESIYEVTEIRVNQGIDPAIFD